jgi:hypothetical protein
MSKQTTHSDSTFIPVPGPGFVLEELDGELLLFCPQDDSLLELNSTAALVWQLCDGARSIAEINALLSAAFPGDEDRIENDVPQILSNLVSLGAISWR